MTTKKKLENFKKVLSNQDEMFFSLGNDTTRVIEVDV